MRQIGGVSLRVVRMSADGAVALSRRRGNRRTVIGRRHSACTGGIRVAVRLIVEMHVVVAVVKGAAYRVRARVPSFGTAVGRIEVIYWSQTNARDAAVVVIPMERLARLGPLPPCTRASSVLNILEATVHTPGLDHIPFLSNLVGKWLPYLLAHAHVLLGDLLKLANIPVIGSLSLHQALMSFAAGIRCFVWKICASDLVPIQTLLSGRE